MGLRQAQTDNTEFDWLLYMNKIHNLKIIAIKTFMSH